MANQNFRVKKGLEVGLGATFLYADTTGVGIGSTQPRSKLDVRGQTQTVDLLVSGVSTLGLTTTIGDLYVGGDLFVADDIVYDEITGRNLSISGIASVGFLSATDARVSGGSTFLGPVNVDSDLVVTGVSTFTGVATFQSDLNVGGNLNVLGDIFYDEITGRNLSISGIATINELGVTNDLVVGGASTFTGVATFQSDLNVGGNLNVLGDIFYDEITGRNLSISGIATINELGVTNDLVVGGASTFTGVATFQSDLNVGGNLNVLGDIVYDEITGRNLSISGIATIANLEVTDSLNVTGPSTFVGLVSFINAVGTGLTLRSIDAHTGKFVEITFESGGGPGGPSSNTGITSNFITTQDLFATGVATFTTGVATQFFAENILAGVVTTTDLFFNTGFGTNLTVTNLDVTGIATLNGSGIATIGGDPVFNTLTVTGVSSLSGDVNVGSALSVTGDSFFVGMGTFSGDLNVGGNLLLDGDLNLDEVFGRNMLISGVGTINTLRSNVGFITTANIEDLNVSGISTVGVITVYEYLADSKAQVGAGDSILATVGGKLLWTRPDQIGISTEFEPGSTFYVSENGSNNNDGLSLEKPWRSVNYALSQIPDGVEDTLVIGSGVYEETFPLNVPKGLTIRGSGQRATLIVPTSATETNDGFILDNASTVEDITIGNMLKPNGSENYAFKFAVGAAITTRSPYISRVTVLNKGTNVTADDPYGYNSADAYPASAPSGGGILADGSVVDASSLEAAMLLNEVTMFVPANKGLVITNGARSEFLNGFIYFAEQGIVGVSSRGTGFAGNGKTRLSLDNASGGLVGSNTIQYYDTDATTILASGTIDSVSGSYVFLTNAGVGTFSVPRNRTAKSVEFVGSAEISNTQARFGPTSLDLAGASDCITVSDSSDFGFGTGDFTIEFWYYRTGVVNNDHIVDFRNTNTDNAISILGNGGNIIEVEVANSIVITGSTAPTLNAWTHIAVTRQSGTLRLFIDGAVDGTAAVATDLGASKPLVVGADFNQANGIAGFADDFRIEKGVAKYTGAFATPTAALKGDKDTSILLHFDGSDGDTTTTDDIIVYQDIRITGGNTADKATLADYSQFGADLRSIGCAVEYGSQGIIGDGDGVTLRLIAVNFNHIGALGDISNDPNLVNQSNEVIEIGNGQVSYVSIDQGGDFRVGDAFYVNQETGEVSFTDTVTDLTALSSLTITDGTNSSIITPTSGRFGNVLISGQTVESVTGDLELKAAGAGEINIYGNTNIIGILTAQIIEINAIQKGDTSIALDDTGSDGTIRFNTDGLEAARIDSNQRTGIKTDNPRAQLDVVGTTRLENLTVTGVATLNGTGIATIGGDPTFRNLNVTGLSTFAGVGTFLSDLNVGGNLNVLGDIVYDEITGRNLSISGIASVGFLSATDVRVSGAATFLGDVLIDGDLTVTGSQNIPNLGVVDLTVTGIATINDARISEATITDANVGVATVGFVTATDGFIGVLTFTRLTNGTTEIGDDIQTRNLAVTGFSTFVGVATFQNDVFIDGNLNLTGDIFYDEITGRNLSISGIATINDARISEATITDANVGVATVGFITAADGFIGVLTVTRLTNGVTDIGDDIQTRNLGVSGIATITDARITDTSIGFATITEAYVGVLTVGTLDGGSDGGTAIGNDIQTRNLGVSGIATINELDVTNDLVVGGASTFTGVSTFLSDLNVGGNLNVLGDIVYDEITGRNLSISGIASVGFLSATDVRVSGAATFLGDVRIDGAQIVDDLGASNLNVTGIATIGFLTATDAHVGNGLTVRNLTVTGDAQLNGSGIVTAGQDINFRNLEVAGFSTFVGLQSFRSAVGTSLTVFNLRVPNNGVVSLPGIPVSGGDAEFRNLNVTGVSSYAGVATFGSDLYVDGDLFVTGAQIIPDLGTQQLRVTGVATVNTLRAKVGFITDLSVSGTSTFVGVATFQNDVFIDGNLNLTGDIFYDEITGRNLSISGIATIGFLSATDAVVGNGLTVTDLTVTGEANLNGSGIVTSGQDVSFRNLEITGFSTFVGPSTFTSGSFNTLLINDNLTVFSDITANFGTRATFSHVNATSILSTAPVGIATLRVVDTDFVDAEGASVGFATITDTSIGFATITEAYVGVLTIGLLDGGSTVIDNDIETRNLSVTGLSTFVGVATFQSDLNVGGNLNVLGDIVYDEITGRNLSISGIATINDARLTDASIGFATITEAYVGVLTVGTLDGGGTAIGNDIETRNLRVTGLSTFVGVGTFENDLYVGGDLNVLGDLTFDEATLRNLTVTGVSTLGIASITTAFIGLGTVLELQSNLILANQGNFTNIYVPGIATIGNLISDGGNQIIIEGSTVITGIVTIGGNSVTINGNESFENIRIGPPGVPAVVSGAQTGGQRTFARFEDGRFDIMNVTGITTTNDLLVSAATTTTDLRVVGFATITEAYVGVLTVGVFDGGTTIGNDIQTRNLSVTGLSTFTGVATFQSDLNVGGNLNVLGDIVYDEITGRNLSISGIATINDARITEARVGFATITEGYVGVLTVGSIDGGGTVVGNDIETRNLRISGLSTFVGVGTFENDLYVGGDLNVLGDIVYDEITGRNLNITGISSLGTVEISSGIITATTGIVTYYGDGSNLTGIDITDSDVRLRNLEVTGLSTFVGVATFQNDLYVGGDLNVLGDIVYDEVSGRNLSISGIATINDARITEANIGFATITDANVGVATIGFATITDAYVGVLTVGVLDGGTTIGNDIQTRNLRVTGLSTFVGVATFQNDLYVDGNLNVTGDIVYDEVSGRNLNISGVTTLGTVQISSGIITATVGVVTYYGDGSGLTGVGASFISIVSDSEPTERPDQSALVNGDLWYDSTGLRQYTYYFDGVSAQWVDSNPQRTVPPLSFAGNSGSGEVGLRTETFSIVGGDNIYTVGSGLTLTVGVSTDINIGLAVAQDLRVTGVATFVGFATITGAYVGVLTVGVLDGGTTIGNDIQTRNLRVTGLSTFVGVGTFENDLYVGGNLNVLGDIVYDEITGRNLSISGVTTLGTVQISSGIITATVGVVTYYGDGSNLTGVGLTQVNGIDVLPRNLNVTGLSTFVGVATFQNDLYVGGDLNVLGDIVYDEITGRNLSISGISSLGTVEISSGIITATTGIVTYYGDGSNLRKIPAATIQSDTPPTQRENGDELERGDIWFDGLGLRQYTYYDDGVTSQWVDSNPQRTVPPLSFVGDSGPGGTIGLATDTFDIEGGSNIFTVGSGTTLTVALTTSITVQNLTATGTVSLPGIPVSGGIATFTALVVNPGITTLQTATATNLTVQNLTATGTVSLPGIPVGGGIATFFSLAVRTGVTTVTDLEVEGNISGDGVTNISGINSVTATEFYGDGSNLTDVDATTLDGLDSTQFLRSDVAAAKTSGNLTFSDNVQARFGDSGDLRIFHSGSSSVISNSNGILIIDNSDNDQDITIQTDDGSGGAATYFRADGSTGEAILYHYGDQKFATKPTGVEVTGDITANNASITGIVTAQDFNSLSDRRVKENIRPIENPLDKVVRINGVHFDFINSGKKSMGVIAQEVEQVFPELISGDFPKSVNYNGLIGLLIESVKELKAENESLRKRVDKLEN